MITIIVMWSVVIVLLIANIIFEPGAFFTVGSTAIGWILLATQLTLQKSNTAYLLWKRIKFFFTNPDCKWNMNIQYKGKFEDEVFDKFVDCLSGEDYKTSAISNNRRIIKVGTISYEVSIDHFNEMLNVQIYDLDVSYRRSQVILGQEIGRHLESFSNSIHFDRTGSSFNAEIEFNKFNPYYGVFIKSLDAQQVKNFNVVFKVDDDRVAITKRKIQLNCDTLSSLTNLTEKYMKLSPR